MIARTLLSLITEAYSDEFLSKVSEGDKEVKELASDIVTRAKNVFKNASQLNWFLKSVRGYDLNSLREAGGHLSVFDHFFSLPIEAIHNLRFGSLSYEEGERRLRELEKKWQEKQSRLIPIDVAYSRENTYPFEYDYEKDEPRFGNYWDEDPTDIVTFSDGFRWMNLYTAYSKIEADAMGHCGNEPNFDTGDTILSLRQLVVQNGEKYLMPHATFILSEDGYLTELKGFQNHKLTSRYMPYVVELFKQFHDIKGIENSDSYKPENDITWKDFTAEQLREISRSNPNIVSEEMRYYRDGRADGVYRTSRGNIIVSSNGGVIIRKDQGGNKEYLNRDLERHRDDGPAVEWSGGTKEWYRNGKLHRDDGPAVEGRSVAKEWWVNGRRHRDDGPAVIDGYGNKMWYRNGELHRDDGPAFIVRDGTKIWYRNGERHRDDRPAVVRPNGTMEWWRDGQPYTPAPIDVARYKSEIRSGEITE